MTFDEIARELYSLAPEEFTAERNRRAKDAPAKVKTLRKPSAAAWLVNMLVRHEGQTIDDIADLGDRMRDAQESLDRDALRALSQQRRTLISNAVKTAAALAKRLEHPASASTLGEVEASLVAAVSDPDAAAAVRSGLLVRSLAANEDAEAIAEAVATGIPRAKRRASRPVADLDAERKKKAARDAARSDLEQAEAVAKKASVAARTARSERESLEQERNDLRAELEFAESEFARADTAARTAERVDAQATADAEAARRRLASLD